MLPDAVRANWTNDRKRNSAESIVQLYYISGRSWISSFKIATECCYGAREFQCYAISHWAWDRDATDNSMLSDYWRRTIYLHLCMCVACLPWDVISTATTTTTIKRRKKTKIKLRTLNSATGGDMGALLFFQSLKTRLSIIQSVNDQVQQSHVVQVVAEIDKVVTRSDGIWSTAGLTFSGGDHGGTVLSLPARRTIRAWDSSLHCDRHLTRYQPRVNNILLLLLLFISAQNKHQ